LHFLQLIEADETKSAAPVFPFLAFLSADGSQHVLEFFRLRRLCRYPGAAGEFCISEIKRLKGSV
jgi:hypothetical protein